MKTLLKLLRAMTLVLLGCNTQSAGSTPESASESTPPAESSASETAKPQLTDVQRERCTRALSELNSEGALITNWNGTPIYGNQSVGEYEIVDLAPADNGLITVTVEMYGEMYLNFDPIRESIAWGDIPVLTKGFAHSPLVPMGKSIVMLRDNAGHFVEPISCSYYPYQSPGISYLKKQSAKNPTPADNPKPDTGKYDPDFVRYIWKQLLRKRFIERPEDITIADLEGMTEPLTIDYDAIPVGMGICVDTYQADASLLRLMPNLTSVNCIIELKDYSVFEGMNKLTELRLSDMSDEGMATLRVGNTNRLHVDEPECDVLDLTHVNTETLSIYSCFTTMDGFKGCDRIKNLYIVSTLTDMRLVNSKSFPSAEYLNLQFYGDLERVHDFSQLTTFGDKAIIDIGLNIMACNDKTVATLAGVKPRLLVLSPNNGTDGRKAPSDELINAVSAVKTIVGDTFGYLDQRTKDSVD